MGDLTSVRSGDEVTVTLTNDDGDLRIDDSNREVAVHLDRAGEIESGETKSITATVTTCIYSTSGSLETIFLSTDSQNGGETTRSARSNSATDSRGRSRGKKHTTVNASRRSKSATRTTSRERTEKLNQLHRIATDLIGDEPVTEKENRTSSIGEAKRRAKKQGRDPAVDPKLRD